MLSKVVRILLFSTAVPLVLWCPAALYFDSPADWARIPLALLFLIWSVATLFFVRRRLLGVMLWLGSLFAVLLWWFSLTPSNNKDWQRDVARLSRADIDGDRVRITNVRDFDYRTEKDFDERWHDRVIDVREIRGVDLFANYWGSPWIAHAIVSFVLADGTYLAMSIEARKTTGQEYSAIRGFFRQFQLIYVVAEERDIVRLRTNYRGEDVYLYRTLTTPSDAQALFMQYVSWINETYKEPQWYNALTENCVSGVIRFLVEKNVGGLSRWDWRTIVNGKGDQMLYEHGDLAGGLPFDELKKRALINEDAKRASRENFSIEIRKGRPGFSTFAE